MHRVWKNYIISQTSKDEVYKQRIIHAFLHQTKNSRLHEEIESVEVANEVNEEVEKRKSERAS